MTLQSTPGSCSLTKLDFEFTDDQKVLLHKYRAEGTYPSQYQQRLADDASAPPADQRIEVDVMVTALGYPFPNQPVYFRVTDPKDTAPYVPSPAAGDNRDSSLPLGELVAREPCPTTPPAGTVCALSQKDGFARVILRTSEHVSGDNYQVEASTDSSFPCGTACPHSGTITTWKRVYVEVNTMLRKGSLLMDQVGPKSGNLTRISIADVRPFQNQGSSFKVLLMRGRSVLDSARNSIESETVTIKNVKGNLLGLFGVHSGELELDDSLPNNTIKADYYADERLPNGLFYDVLADAVALVPTSRNDYYVPAADKADALFGDAYVEYTWLIDPSAAASELPPAAARIPLENWIPYIKTLTNPQSRLMSIKWGRSIDVQILPGSPPPLTPFGLNLDIQTRPNHQPLFIGAASIDFEGGIVSGATFHEHGHRPTWVYTDTANRQSANSNYLPWVTAHELGHQWDVNTSTPIHHDFARGHCGGVRQREPSPSTPALPAQPVVPRWNGPEGCLMTDDALNQAPTSTTANKISFHYRIATVNYEGASIPPQEDSEYIVIRTALEPIPQR